MDDVDVVLDDEKNIVLPAEDPPLMNVQALWTFREGIHFLANLVRNHEVVAASAGQTEVASPWKELLPSIFQEIFNWFSISLVSYLRVVGLIGLMKEKGWTSTDLESEVNRRAVRRRCGEYVREVVPEVWLWRNKVPAHPAITMPHDEDNLATLEASLLFHVSYDKPYFSTGTMIWGSAGVESELPAWALTKVFDGLESRLWPGESLRPIPSSKVTPAQPDGTTRVEPANLPVERLRRFPGGRTVAKFATDVDHEVSKYEPHEWVRYWSEDWSETFRALVGERAIFEVVSLVCSRMEFCARLYLGAWKKDDRGSGQSGSAYVRRYAEVFMRKVRSRYGARSLHEIRGVKQLESDFFSSFRNASLHSYVPGPLLDEKRRRVISWRMGLSNEMPVSDHLRNRDGYVHVVCDVLAGDFLRSMDFFAGYLEKNRKDRWEKERPAGRFRRAFWAANRPIGETRSTWIQEGLKAGLYNHS